MTRKDYEKIAQAVRQVNEDVSGWEDARPDEVLDLLASYLCKVLEQDNPRFDRERFLSACGFE